MRHELIGIVAMVKAEQFDLAFQTAQKIEGASVRSFALMKIAETLAEAGQFECAVEVVETIDDPVAPSQAIKAIRAAKQKMGKGEAWKR